MNSWVKIAVLAVAAVVVFQILGRHREAPPVGPATAAPPLALADLSGRTVDLASLRGRVVVVNFWASWCPPCKAELPELAEFWRAHQGKCFELLGVAESSGREDVAALAPRIPYPVLFDARADAVDPWQVQGFPVTYVVDPEGKVRRRFEGAITKEELGAAVAPLLPASCPRT